MSRQAKVLVVDDEAAIREIVGFDLERAGYAVQYADGGKAAFAQVQEGKPDLVLSDVRMPAGSGVDLLRWVREKDPLSPPLVFMTAFSDISSDEALDQGAVAFLTKPLVKQDLLAVVETALTLRTELWSKPVDSASASRLRPATDDWLVGGAPPRVVLGSGGAFVEMDQDLPESLEIVAFDLPLTAPDAPALSGVGRVRWVRQEGSGRLPAGVGLEFLYLADASRQWYLQHLRSQRPIAYVPLGVQ